MKPTKILVPVDFSPFSDWATDYAIALASHYKAKITLFHVVVLYEADLDEEIHLSQLEELIERKELRSDELLSKQSKKLSKINLELDSRIERGLSASDTILEYAGKNNYDLIVMGTHGRTGIKNWIYGSVTEKVVRLSTIPVITLHNDPGLFKIENILVPIDFSENSRLGACEAAVVAEQFKSKITFVHVVEQHIHPSFHVVGIESVFAINADLKQISQEKLAEFCKREDLNPEYKVLEGNVHQSIADYAADCNADLIIMSTRGFTGLDHLLIGSTTERVVRIAPCPVLTICRTDTKN